MSREHQRKQQNTLEQVLNPNNPTFDSANQVAQPNKANDQTPQGTVLDKAASNFDFKDVSIFSKPTEQPYETPIVPVETNQLTETNKSVVAGGGASSVSAPIQREGQSIPGGVNLENVDTDSARVVQHISTVANGVHGTASNVNWQRRVGPLVDLAIAGRLSQRSFGIDFVEDRGINVHWFGTVTFRMGTPQPLTGGGTGNVTLSSGGTGSVGNTSAIANTDGATASGTVTNAPPGATGGTTVGGTAGVNTSSTRTDTNSSTATASGSGASTTTNNLERFQAPLIVSVDMSCEPDISGSDYINPFKWGIAAADAVSPSHSNGDAVVGSIQYFRSNGIAGSGAPVQRKGWIEQELGITDESQANLGRYITAQSMNPNDMSRAGAHPLAPPIASVAEQYHGRSLENVNLIQGAQADWYADSMQASAFTVPNGSNGSDIFVHSNLDLGSDKGQHTLQHEISHAIQNMKGETSELSGLGGSESRRLELERAADTDAQSVLDRGQGNQSKNADGAQMPAFTTFAAPATPATLLKRRD
jgi:Domain of unknown function (DUF4157)